METYSEVIKFIDDHFIKGIFLSIIFIMVARFFFKGIDYQMAINIIKWLLIAFSTGVVLNLLILLLFPVDSNNNFVFLERIKGPYKYAYWAMLIASVLPLLLLFKKLGDKVYFILLLAVLMNLGWLFESFIIHITGLHGDYSNDGNNYKAYLLPFHRELIIISEGIIWGIIVIVIGNLITKKNKCQINTT